MAAPRASAYLQGRVDGPPTQAELAVVETAQELPSTHGINIAETGSVPALLASTKSGQHVSLTWSIKL